MSSVSNLLTASSRALATDVSSDKTVPPRGKHLQGRPKDRSSFARKVSCALRLRNRERTDESQDNITADKTAAHQTQECLRKVAMISRHVVGLTRIRRRFVFKGVKFTSISGGVRGRNGFGGTISIIAIRAESGNAKTEGVRPLGREPNGKPFQYLIHGFAVVNHIIVQVQLILHCPGSFA